MDTNEIRVFIQEHWGDAVLTAIDAEPALQMSFDEFLNHCTAHGENWGGMLLSGLKNSVLKFGMQFLTTWVFFLGHLFVIRLNFVVFPSQIKKITLDKRKNLCYNIYRK